MLVQVSSTDMDRKATKRITSTYAYGKTRQSFPRGTKVDPQSSIYVYEAKDMHQRAHPQGAPVPEREAEYEDGDSHYAPLSSPSARLMAVIRRPI